MINNSVPVIFKESVSLNLIKIDYHVIKKSSVSVDRGDPSARSGRSRRIHIHDQKTHCSFGKFLDAGCALVFVINTHILVEKLPLCLIRKRIKVLEYRCYVDICFNQ